MFKQMGGKQSAGGASLPLHAQAELFVRELLRKPSYQSGELLPDEVTLANHLGISRGTLRAALGRLVQEGLLERRAGVGTRLARRPAESGITAWRSFSSEMARAGVRVVNLRQEYRRCPSDVPAARALGVATGTPVWRLDRVRGWSGKPVLHSRSWFHPRLGLKGTEVFDRPLYDVLLDQSGASAETAREEFKAVTARPAMARRLGVPPGEPLLLRTHAVFDAGGRPMEFAEVHYVSRRFTLTLDLRREANP